MSTPIPAISEELKKELNDAITQLGKSDAGNSNFANVVTKLARADVPASFIPSQTTTITELREEIKWQGDEFNQIDSKVGIVLGFVLIFAGQLLTLFTSKSTDVTALLNALKELPFEYYWLYGFAVMIAASLICGVICRWPGKFIGTSIASNLEPKAGANEKSEHKTLSESAVFDGLYYAVRKNRITLSRKDRFGTLCNAFAAVCLLGVALLIAGSIRYQQKAVAADNSQKQAASKDQGSVQQPPSLGQNPPSAPPVPKPTVQKSHTKPRSIARSSNSLK